MATNTGAATNTGGISEAGSSKASPSPAVSQANLDGASSSRRECRDTVTIQGPRNDIGKGDDATKVKATVDRSDAGRLMITFHNVGTEGKGKGKLVEGSEIRGNCDEAVDMLGQMGIGQN